MLKLVNFLTQPLESQIATLEWRNSEQVSRWFQIKNIELDTHKKWLESLKNNNPRCIAFFIEYMGKFVGVTYFHSIDYSKKETDWGIYIYDIDLRGKGIGTEVLDQALDYARNEMKMNQVFLEVLSENHRAQKVYENAGFVFCEQKDDGMQRYKHIFAN